MILILTGIQNAINYVEGHLTENINYEEVAKEAACSSFYFQFRRCVYATVCYEMKKKYLFFLITSKTYTAPQTPKAISPYTP